MNELGIALVWLLVQVSVVALAGLGLSALAARRAPGAGAPTALTALAATVLLAALACCPLPTWWTWDRAVTADVPESTATTTAEPIADDDERPHGEGLQVAALLALMRSLGRDSARADTASAVRWTWPAVVTVCAALGTGLGMVRLLLGLWAVRKTMRDSRPVTDADLLRLVAELGEALGVTRSVAVRESAELATAATVGWRRPVLLLPPDWRGWTTAQQRAAIAHELAHVQRGDFAAWLVARLGVAVHFWHPLVRALAGRLQLEQELAADATAARLAGGRPTYLRVLAELALHADGRADRWPAPAFLSRKGTLLRRIDMLHVMDDGPRRRTRSTVGRLAFALLCGCTLIVSAWRFPAREAQAGPSAAEDIVPFDLALVAKGDDKCDGCYGVRPAAILSHPAALPMAKVINKYIDMLSAPVKAGGIGIHIEDVEQIMGRVTFGGENKPGKRTMMFSLNVLRMTRDTDWVKLRDQCGTLFKKHEWHGETYVNLATPDLLKALTGGRGDMYLWAADARTLILESDTVIKEQIDAKIAGKKLPLPAYAAGWDKVSRDLFAVALDNRGGRLAKRCITADELKDALADDTKPESHAIRFFQHVEHFVVGCAGDDDFRFDVHATAANAAAAQALAKACEGLRKAAMEELNDAANKAAVDDTDTAFLALLKQATAQATIRPNGSTVTVHAEAASGFNALLAAYAKEFKANQK